MSDKKKKFDKESLTNTLVVAIGLCLICATLVSASAVFLKSLQDANKLKDKKKNILAAAGLLESNSDVVALFDQRIIDRIVDLDSGDDVTSQYDDVASFDQIGVAESNDQKQSEALTKDPATIKRRENHSHVYIVKASATDESPSMYVFPIRGKGLWSILKGFIAIDADLKTIKGLTYYEHGETPGLGGEVDNPIWKSHWVGKLLFDDKGKMSIRLVKSDWETNPHGVDTLSGATITARGVEKMLGFWMGEQGFGPYLEILRAGTSNNVAQAAGGQNGKR